MNGADYSQWLGRTRQTEAWLDPWPCQALHATVASPAAPVLDQLPLLWHWLYFLDTPQRDEQGADGHPRKGGFLPPVANPRRMFVGARSEILSPLQLGQGAQLTETIISCEEKHGSSGAMTLLRVGFDYHQAGQLCVREQRDFMYLPGREGAQPEAQTATEASLEPAQWGWDVTTDPVLLFKFSALTFNGHRIHYDLDYARQAEAYPNLVVHGPLTALLLVELARSQLSEPLRHFNFRARAPLYAGDRLRLRANQLEGAVQLTAFRPDGQAAMTAEVALGD